MELKCTNDENQKKAEARATLHHHPPTTPCALLRPPIPTPHLLRCNRRRLEMLLRRSYEFTNGRFANRESHSNNTTSPPSQELVRLKKEYEKLHAMVGQMQGEFSKMMVWPLPCCCCPRTVHPSRPALCSIPLERHRSRVSSPLHRRYGRRPPLLLPIPPVLCRAWGSA